MNHFIHYDKKIKVLELLFVWETLSSVSISPYNLRRRKNETRGTLQAYGLVQNGLDIKRQCECRTL